MKTLKFLFVLTAFSAFWQSGYTQCAGLNVYQYQLYDDTINFATAFYSADSATATLNWDFGDGQTYSGAYGQHAYTTTGHYNICLTYSGSLCSGIICDSVYVNTCVPANNLSVSQSTSGGVTSFVVNNAPVGATYSWSFGSGGSISTSTIATPQVTFPANGNYYCGVSVNYGNGCQYTKTFYVNTYTTCNAQWISQPSGNDVNLYSALANVDGATYTWDLGDGSTATSYLVQHHYASFGTYNVCLIVSTAGCADTVCGTVTTSQPPCAAGDTLIRNYQNVNGTYVFDVFDADSIQASGLFNWDFGDGTNLTGNYNGGYNHHTYTTSGTYIVCLNYTNTYCTGVDCDTIIVDLCNVTSEINSYRVDSTLYYSLSAANPSWTYQWNFPGGTPSTSTSATPVIAYPGAGDYYANVEITIPGCSNDIFSVSTNIPIIEPGDSLGCNASFHYTYNGTLVYFYPTDSATRMFDYGDGSTGSNTTHWYANYGTYNVCLISTEQTCSDSFCTQVTVSPPMTNIFGTIAKQGIGPACNAEVFLIKDSLGYLSLVDTYIIADSFGCTGEYDFNLQEGTYYVKARLLNTDPDYANFMPTYFSDVLSWADASPVVTTATNGPWSIALIPGVNPGGPGFIGGNVSEGAGLAAIGNGEERGVGDPIANVQINLLTDNDVAVAYTYTDANGRYTFNDLPLGGYRVLAEMLDKTPLSQVVALTANNPSQDNVDVLVNSNSAVTGINDIADINVDGVFPNPVKNVATIRFTAKLNASATIKVTDMKGSVVSTINANIITGNNELKIDLANQAAGVYTVSITNNDNKKVIKLLKAN